jgi:TRAP-type transport system periplasmic protein
VHLRAALAAAAALAVAAAACGGSGGDKAGGEGTSATKALVLTLVEPDPDFGSGEFAEAVSDRSGGSIRIEVETGRWSDEIDSEGRIVEDVRAGRADLAIVGARVWDTLGVDGFQALLAPFLVDSLDLERRVLESPLASRMLASVREARVVGIALLPGALRRSFGHTRALVGLRDYRGATIGVRPGDVEEATFRALGASTRPYVSLHPSFFAGAALHPWSIAENGYEGETLVTNVAFWPRAETIVMNPKAFEGLTPAQRTILREAGRAAVGRQVTRIERVEEEAVGAICAQELVSLATASPADIVSLQDAVRPVYAALERDLATRALIAEIRKLDDGSQSERLRCPEAGASVAPELEGRWEATASREDLLAVGASPKEVREGRNALTLELERERWIARSPDTGRVWTGAYSVSGDLIRLTLETCSHNPCTPGATADHAWSVYRDTLSVTRLPGRRFWWQLTAKPFKRAR